MVNLLVEDVTISRIIVRGFESIWNLKDFVGRRNGHFSRGLYQIYGLYQYENGVNCLEFSLY